METLRSNANKMINYPSPEIMELFLNVGYKTNLFDGIEKFSDGNFRYKNVNAITTLAIICDYLCQPGKEKEKQSFLNELKKDDKTFYKKMGEFALNIWEGKPNLSNFSKAMIKSGKKKLKRVDSNIWCFPTIEDEDSFPKRINEIRGTKIIHKEFEAELIRLKGVSKGADKIQAETENHQFNRGDNSHQINDLENKL